MKVLVAGGAGYIGSVTSERLLRAGHEVVIIDNLGHGHREALPAAATFIEGDLIRLDAVRQAFERHRPDAVMHFAGDIQVGESMRKPFQYLQDNVACGLNLLRAAVESGVRRVVFSSTANLYDKPERIPIDEATPPLPGSPYGEMKLYIERTLAWLERTHDVRSASLRYFNAAGATAERGEDHDPETHLIPLVLRVALGTLEKISIFGQDYDTPDGTCIRDYIHVSDLADAHVLALNAIEKGSRTYNVGTGRGYSVTEVVEAARRVTGRPIATVAAPRRAGDVPRLVADPAKIQRELGWKPGIPDLERIVESAWKWHRDHPRGYGA